MWVNLQLFLCDEKSELNYALYIDLKENMQIL